MNKISIYTRWIFNCGIGRFTRFRNYAISPKIISVEITDDCNLSCPMCPRRFSRVTGRSMPFERFKFILDQLPTVNSMILLGRGETLMAPDIFKMLDYGKSRDIHFTIVTNGLLLTEENINRFKNVAKVIVSIDHPYPEGYRKIRGAGLEVIIENMRRLKRVKRYIYLIIQPLIMDENIEDLAGFVSLARDTGADAVKIVHPIAFDQGLDKKHADNFLNVTEKLDIAQKLAKRNGIRFDAVPSLSRPRLCLDPWMGPRISLDGDIYPCCFIYENSEPIWEEWYQGVCISVPQSKYIMGNIFKESFNKIWNGNNYRILRSIVKETEESDLLTPHELNTRRQEKNLNGWYPYCQICLYRQNRAC